MGKISDKLKVIFVKSHILFTFTWMLVACFVGFRIESGLNPEWQQLYLVIIGIYGLLVVVMVYLMNKIDITPTKVNPIIKHIKLKDYVGFKQLLFAQAVNQGYDEVDSISMNENVETTLALKKVNGATYVLQTIWMQELDMELLDMATDSFWKKVEDHVGKDTIQNQAIGLMQCVCVQRMNRAFRQYITQNVHQEYKRYQILAAVSFGGRRAYICQTKGGFFRSYYRYLKREFDFIAEPVWNMSKE